MEVGDEDNEEVLVDDVVVAIGVTEGAVLVDKVGAGNYEGVDDAGIDDGGVDYLMVADVAGVIYTVVADDAVDFNYGIMFDLIKLR